MPCIHGTWASEIWPYIELVHVKEAWPLTVPYATAPPEVVQTQVAIYFCPTRRAPGQLSINGDALTAPSRGGVHVPGALSDYAVSTGDGNPASDYPPPWGDANDAFIAAFPLLLDVPGHECIGLSFTDLSLGVSTGTTHSTSIRSRTG